MHTLYTLGYQASTPKDLADQVRRLGALLADVQRLAVPVPARGSLGLWVWDLPRDGEGETAP